MFLENYISRYVQTTFRQITPNTVFNSISNNLYHNDPINLFVLESNILVDSYNFYSISIIMLFLFLYVVAKIYILRVIPSVIIDESKYANLFS